MACRSIHAGPARGPDTSNLPLSMQRWLLPPILCIFVYSSSAFSFLANPLRGIHRPYPNSAENFHCCKVPGKVFRPNFLKSLAGTYVESEKRPITKLRLIQHKKEAFWFYRFLSIVYDTIVNPGHWTEDMRKEALAPAELGLPNLETVDVGGGTGFCTIGVIEEGVRPENIILIDQSPHQLEKAKQKTQLAAVKIMQGDAEDLPFETDSKDRYVSAGSIEYWPEPQRGICEAYRILRPGGLACVIGPVYPTNPISRFFADVWMLFPTEDEYIKWFTDAGFKDVKITRIGPWWYHGVRRHGLIMGCSVTGRKGAPGPSPLKLPAKAEDVERPSNPALNSLRLLLGTVGGFYYFLVPVYMLLKHVLILPLSLFWKGAHTALM